MRRQFGEWRKIGALTGRLGACCAPFAAIVAFLVPATTIDAAPPSAELASAPGKLIVADTEKGRPDGNIKVLYNLRYREGSKHCTLDLALPLPLPRPNQRTNRPRPAVLVIHGGGWIEGDKSSFVVARTPGNILAFAAAGFVAATVNYRLSGEAPYPAAVDDCRCAVRWLRAHADEYHVDRRRIGAYGNSAGGHLALLLALSDRTAGPSNQHEPFDGESSQVEAAASDSGPIDLVTQYKTGAIRTVVGRFMGGPPEGARLAAYKEASPINHLGGPTPPPPLLLIYGEADEQVDVHTADRMVAELSRAGRNQISYFRLAGVGHCPHSLLRVPYLQPAVIEFFRRALGK